MFIIIWKQPHDCRSKLMKCVIKKNSKNRKKSNIFVFSVKLEEYWFHWAAHLYRTVLILISRTAKKKNILSLFFIKRISLLTADTAKYLFWRTCWSTNCVCFFFYSLFFLLFHFVCIFTNYTDYRYVKVVYETRIAHSVRHWNTRCKLNDSRWRKMSRAI